MQCPGWPRQVRGRRPGLTPGDRTVCHPPRTRAQRGPARGRERVRDAHGTDPRPPTTPSPPRRTIIRKGQTGKLAVPAMRANWNGRRRAGPARRRCRVTGRLIMAPPSARESQPGFWSDGAPVGGLVSGVRSPRVSPPLTDPLSLVPVNEREHPVHSVRQFCARTFRRPTPPRPAGVTPPPKAYSSGETEGVGVPSVTVLRRLRRAGTSVRRYVSAAYGAIAPGGTVDTRCVASRFGGECCGHADTGCLHERWPHDLREHYVAQVVEEHRKEARYPEWPSGPRKGVPTAFYDASARLERAYGINVTWQECRRAWRRWYAQSEHNSTEELR